ncbi:methionine ABC transporter ATP-binding protein [Epilithonimonas ginsengisoli]|uniref:Methionine ABC transporter ATP-binding protein n=1 Tax=Epilithonimonas ginsengisoli TaxID=1245592 RepID=A0ABU4JEE3_9FLAO|nr:MULTISPECIES: methionine ABC transporter ATP-binding protein [Chryseobacterium group]MBV6879284.1 methionine ABC transporter ATP-binding protein [Epilithonimonas sp. FP105]MDW8548019.1 methionine ABC transporter ATP-binding protein [Epilithonimonas ginsengisoli]OAH73062.1 methionine ABC transporter ATP-binding protein [Chryseobacterium sp. FP211-J200]
MIELLNVTKSFKTKNKTIQALADVSLTVEKGEIFGVIGTSGAGKSTLIRCVNLLEKPNAGKVIVDNIELTKLSDAQLTLERRKIAMIFQHFNLLSSRTVFDNIAFPLELEGQSKSEIKEKVNGLLELVGLNEKAKDYPANLSGGQKQRVAIARALANDPKVLLCDEATSALDPATTKSILKLLKSINQKLNLTILLITHEMEVIKTICDKVAVIDHGKLAEQGNVEQIFTNPQQEITKGFIQSSLNIELPLVYQNSLSNIDHGNSNPLVKFMLTGNNDQSFVISNLFEKFQVKAKVISAQLEYVGNLSFGVLLVELQGKNINEALAYLENEYSNTEILGYVG